jgi:hypothetical protein
MDGQMIAIFLNHRGAEKKLSVISASLWWGLLSADGKAYAYTYRTVTSDLYAVEGAR